MVNSTRAAIVALALAAVAGVSFLSAGAEPVEARQAAPPPVKLAIINSGVILNDAPGRAAAQAVLDREMGTIRTEVQRMGDSLQAMFREYEAIEATLSPSARDARRKAIEDKQAQFEARTDSLRSRADRRQAELMQPILDLVNKVIQDVRDENGYTVIFDIGTQAHGIVSYDRNLDITDRVLARVRREPAPAQPPAGGGRGRTDTTRSPLDAGRSPPRR